MPSLTLPHLFAPLLFAVRDLNISISVSIRVSILPFLRLNKWSLGLAAMNLPEALSYCMPDKSWFVVLATFKAIIEISTLLTLTLSVLFEVNLV